MRRLIFCFDGSWNKLSLDKEPTNVAVVAQSIMPIVKAGKGDKQDCQQIVYYDEGVGTSSDDVWRGGITGQGLKENIREAYRFLIFNYQPGDEIFTFGFSRGAFTALSFIGFVRACGILSVDKARHIDEAYGKYTEYAYDIDDDPVPLQEYRAKHSPLVMVDAADKDWREHHGYDVTQSHILEIKYIGVWDMVGSLGWKVPLAMIDRRTNKQYRSHDTNLSMMVERARHAVSIDERRVFFMPTLWGNVSQLNAYKNASNFDEHAPYQQKWFPGDHSSVGGGGVHRGLSNAALHWVIDGAVQQGLKFNLDSGSEIRDIRYNHFQSLMSSPLKGFFAHIGHAIKKVIISASRSGPEDVNDIHPAAFRRWFANPEDLAETKEYRPKTLRHLAKKIDKQKNIYAPLEYKSAMKSYEVIIGDTLSKIAKEQLSDSKRWQDIFNLNRDRLDSPNHIFPGDILRMPEE